MTSPEARRHDLYNGLIESLGEDRADTLMAYLPTHASTELATRPDLAEMEGRLNQRLDLLVTRLDELSRRVDRILLAMIAGLVAIVATLISQLPG